jgi:nicotinamidase-related amidase
MTTPTFEKQLTGLLVIDPYNDFISEGGILWPLIKEVAEAVDCVPNMIAVLGAARAAGIRSFSRRIIATTGQKTNSKAGNTSHPFRNSPTNDVSSQLELGVEPSAKNSRHCQAKSLRRNTGAPAVSQTQISTPPA